MNAYTNWKGRLLTVMVLAVMSSLAAVATAADVTEQNVAGRIATAKTAEEHKAIGAFFRAQATAAGDKVKEHEAMLASYQSGRGVEYPADAIEGEGVQHHCEDAIASYKKLQKDYEALAAEHEKMAKKAGGR